MIATNKTSADWIAVEQAHTAHNYHPLPVVLEKASGIYAWDVEGKKYIDCLAAYSAVNQGHCHPKITEALIKQAQQLSLTSRAFYSRAFAAFTEYITDYFGFDRFLPANTGVEAVEAAMKLCRKWAYQVKGLAENKAKIIVCRNNFHGRTITVISASSDETARAEFGPFTPGFVQIPFNDVQALELALQDPDIAGFLVEPIQGEAGVIVPAEGYLKACAALCQKHNVLFIADEIQTGLGRTGRMLACDYENVKPDLLILGKALSGGMYPVSGVLGSDEVMLCFKPGEHGSTYGGNPLACVVSTAALEVIREEDLSGNSERMGLVFRDALQKINHVSLRTIRGKGLMNAIEIEPSAGKSAWDVCLRMMELGVLAKPTHNDTIRLSPPLIIKEAEILQVVDVINRAIED
ncbi:MAG: ornithine--oxo-acid transaminase [Bacteroidia bacterium]|nr:ornithine--oxo-acid transaminase [Bacteroidia bacterium]